MDDQISAPPSGAPLRPRQPSTAEAAIQQRQAARAGLLGDGDL
jgi:hypothetical protein